MVDLYNQQLHEDGKAKISVVVISSMWVKMDWVGGYGGGAWEFS
jgi:hypothetical protein